MKKFLALVVTLLSLIALTNASSFSYPQREGWCWCLEGDTSCDCSSYWSKYFPEYDEVKDIKLDTVEDFFNYIDMVFEEFKLR